jgi:PPOX class probable F420-dependent enzyme
MPIAILDPRREDDAHTAARLTTEPIIWLSSTRADNRPHRVPVWFGWHDPFVVIFSMPRTAKLRNIGHIPFVALSLDSASYGQDIVLLEGRAKRVDESDEMVRQMLPLFSEKYAAMLPAGEVDSWRRTFSQPVLISVSRVVAWTRKAGELAYRSLP